MKIGIYDPYLDSLSGGEKYVLTAASCLSHGNKVSIFWDDQAILEKAGEKLSIDLSKTQIVPNIFASNVSLAQRLRKTHEYDLLFILSDGSIPVTLSSRTILHFQFPVEWVNANNLLTKLKLRKVYKIVCNSFFTKRLIDKKFNADCIVIYPPCVSSKQTDQFLRQKEKNKKQNIILNVGRISPLTDGVSIKKQELLIKNFKQMIDNGLKNWELILAVSYFKKNQNIVSNLVSSIKNYPIKIITNCDYVKLEILYATAKIYWHAAGFGENLIQHPERAEHFGITTVEAMAREVVPVVISAGGQPEIVNDNINGFLWETEEELIDKTKKIMTNEKLRKQMANLARKKSHQFSVEKFCEQIQKLVS